MTGSIVTKTDRLNDLAKFMSKLTVKRVSLTVVFAILMTLAYTVYEHRTDLYNRIIESTNPDAGAIRMPGNGKFYLLEPNVIQDDAVRKFMLQFKEAVMVTVVDADPVKNQRTAVKKYFSNRELELLFGQLDMTRPSTNALFSTNEKGNQQLVRILSGEITCDPSSDGYFGNMYPEALSVVKYTCRVPLPPAFGKVAGWIAIHFTKYPPIDTGLLRYQMLSLSQMYYQQEVEKALTRH